MFQQYFQQKDLVTLPILTMLLFGVVFFTVLVRSLQKRPSEQMTRLPLEDERTAARRGAGAEDAHV